jgi:formylglycine-generating enzyme required for sulfatase activity
MLTDVKYLLSQNPLRPIYREDTRALKGGAAPAAAWIKGPRGAGGGIHAIGYDGPGFAFYNEYPRHDELLRPFRIANRLITNAEYLIFIADGDTGALSSGYPTASRAGTRLGSAVYWAEHEGSWWSYTPTGFRLPMRPSRVPPSYYGTGRRSRVPAGDQPSGSHGEGNAVTEFRGESPFHPPADGGTQLFGDVWEWTGSPYLAYPGYRPVVGALGEYNAKFMCNQFVLRGGSCATPASHIRSTYRNFFPPDARWQFSGIRLTTDG